MFKKEKRKKKKKRNSHTDSPQHKRQSPSFYIWDPCFRLFWFLVGYVPANTGDEDSIPGLGRSPGVEDGNPLQCYCLENSMDRGAWQASAHGVAKSQTWLSNFTFTFHYHALEKEMATHSSVIAWRIPGMGEPGGLPSMGSHRVGHDWSDLPAAAGTWLMAFHLESNQGFTNLK